MKVKSLIYHLFPKGVSLMQKAEILKQKTKIEDQSHVKIEDQSNLKGTLTFVFLLGAFIIVTWIGVYSLFLERL
jgi:hypothetical protein